MLRFLADENFNGDLADGLVRHESSIDLVRAQDVGLLGADDPEILEWAAEEHRVVLTHDKQTMPGFAFARATNSARELMTSIFVRARR